MSYPLQYFRIGIGNTDNNIVASGSTLSPSHHTGKPHEKWYVNYKSASVFQIVNVSNNQVIQLMEMEFHWQIIRTLQLKTGK